MRYLILILFALFTLNAIAQEQGVDISLDAPELTTPTVSVDSVYMKTSGGDIVITLYEPEDTLGVDHFRRLVRAGVFNHTKVNYIEKDQYIQLGYHGDVTRAYTESQNYELYPLPLSPTPATHKKYSVSLIPDADGNAISTFAIMLSDMPDYDKDQHVIGEVVLGQDVIQKWNALSVDDGDRPLKPVVIQAAFLADTSDAIRLFKDTQNAQTYNTMRTVVPLSLGLVILILFAYFWVYTKVSNRTRVALVLSAIFVAGITLVISLNVSADKSLGILGLPLILGLLAFLKLMNRFESQFN